MLQTKDFAVTGVSSGGGITYTYILRVTEQSVDMEKNTSRVTLEAILKQSYTGTAFYNWSTGVSCVGNGQTFFSDYRQRSLSGTKEHSYHTWEGEIPHNDDGTLTLSLTAKLWQADPASYSPPAMTVSGEMILTPIPRASKVGAADGSIGSHTTIVITPATAGMTHSIGYRFGSLQGFLDADGSLSETEKIFAATTISFPVPESFYWEIPESDYGECTLTVTTYREGKAMGSRDTVFRCLAEKSRCAPIVTATVTEGNELGKLLSGGDKLVRFVSEAVCRVTVQCQWGANLVSTTCNGVAMDTIMSFPCTETGTYVFRVTDSRGHETTVTVEKELISYIELTCHATASRIAPTTGEVQLSVHGSGFWDTFGMVRNGLTGEYQVLPSEVWKELPLTETDEGYTAQLRLSGLDYTRSHRIRVRITDQVTNVTAEATVQPGIPVFCWGKDYFRFHVPVQFAAGIIE